MGRLSEKDRRTRNPEKGERARVSKKDGGRKTIGNHNDEGTGKREVERTSRREENGSKLKKRRASG
ncbi:Hypothetical protein FKW44_014063 [Caligus rogercresseyi]|uniref:Uncharacterized protein n=1 Tax=Caligus rogercresseyi TaxID=217165 RepID=A0A7T8GYC7_CALRO|nr:Hypothetical protein FKW44_014063 [Caligus rogercresseyi]